MQCNDDELCSYSLREAVKVKTWQAESERLFS